MELGPDPESGAAPQAVIPKGHWFAAKTAPAGSFSLAGCTTAPGFDFRDFELAERENLARQHPRLRATIQELTR
jgi:predicted cupin superfamily sugar epimerase